MVPLVAVPIWQGAKAQQRYLRRHSIVSERADGDIASPSSEPKPIASTGRSGIDQDEVPNVAKRIARDFGSYATRPVGRRVPFAGWYSKLPACGRFLGALVATDVFARFATHRSVALT
jgi:hypothetical protein